MSHGEEIPGDLWGDSCAGKTASSGPGSAGRGGAARLFAPPVQADHDRGGGAGGPGGDCLRGGSLPVEILPVEGEEWDPDAEVSFQVSGDVRRMELSEFSQAVRDEVRERIEEGGWDREHRFDTWAEAGEYLGVELSGPTGMMVDASLVVKEGRFIEVRLRGDVDGEDYGVEEGTSLWLDASLYTEDLGRPPWGISIISMTRRGPRRAS